MAEKTSADVLAVLEALLRKVQSTDSLVIEFLTKPEEAKVLEEALEQAVKGVKTAVAVSPDQTPQEVGRVAMWFMTLSIGGGIDLRTHTIRSAYEQRPVQMVKRCIEEEIGPFM